MNRRTARLIRRWATQKEFDYRDSKRQWDRLPAVEKEKVRRRLERELDELRP